MLSSVINSLRAFKGLYDLAFLEKKFYVDSRAEFKNGIVYGIEQFKEGYNNPRPASEKPVLIRGPLKIMLLILGIILTIAVMFGGR
jgi:hypothetical protein